MAIIDLLVLHILWFIHPLFLCYGKLSTPSLRQITDPVDHAEGPTWDGRKNVLYFVDIHAGKIYSYEYESGNTHSLCLNGEVTPIVPSKKDPELLIVGMNRTLLAIKWDGKNKIGEHKSLATVSNQFPTSRFNDGKADKQGRLWFGTMGFENSYGVVPNQGILYRITKGDYGERVEVRAMLAPVSISNGLAWNKANNKFYYIDTPTRKIVEYDYDDEKGQITNGKVVFNVLDHKKITGWPDGMTIDVEDNLWVALYGGGAVIKVNPKSRKIMQTVAIPAEAVTSVMWGGPKLDILYVTTSRFRLTVERKRQQPAAGSVFAVEGLRTRGRPMFMADVLDV